MKKYKYESMLVGCAAFWGLAFPVMKLVGENIDSISFLAIRFTIATLVLTVICREKIYNLDKKMIFPCVGLGLLMALHSFLQIEGLKYTSSVNSSFITSMNVIFVPIFMYLFFRKKPKRNIIIGLSVIILGFLLISGVVSIFPCSFHLTSFNKGDLLTLMCAIFTAAYMIAFNQCSVKYDEMLVNTVHMGGAACGMWIFWIFSNEKVMIFSSISTIAGTIYCGVFASAVAFLLLAKAQAKLEASKVAVICALEPVFATIFTTLVWHDSVTLTTLVGGILILVGVIKSSI